MIEEVFNALAVVSTAAFAGVMICIGVTLGAFWRSLEPVDFLAWFARNNRYVARSVPVTVAPALVGLVGSVTISAGESSFWLWVASSLCLVATLVLTAAFFVPANKAFERRSVALVEVADRLRRWLRLHALRVALACGGAIIGCIAIGNG